MENRRLDTMLRWLDGRLPDADRRAFEAELNRSDALRVEVDALRGLRLGMQDALRAEAAGVADPYLADRVLRRIEAPRPVFADELALWLGQVFRPVAIAGALVVVLLAGYNVRLSQSFATESSTAEAMLGLPPVSTASVYDLDVFDAQAAVTP
jgi:anti-sigma factor RsiW